MRQIHRSHRLHRHLASNSFTWASHPWPARSTRSAATCGALSKKMHMCTSVGLELGLDYYADYGS